MINKNKKQKEDLSEDKENIKNIGEVPLLRRHFSRIL